ncbi:uncharacterized protein LOC108332655 [Vigna angularis]|uniref:uncharacterized protein LOC108332655 n=1 Tax=Phaseolus angularis TaxID=3914 RepID=UPI0022B5CCF4|nr:uncharacterized protein LOC108332655 [Vigna angularis]
MAFRTGNDAIWCRAFSLSLEGEALEWFNSLPPNSIENFAGLQRLFNQQFASSSTQDLTVFELVTLKQGNEETLRTFMDHYQKIVQRVKGLSPELSLHYILLALRPGPFKDNVCWWAPKTMEELQERARRMMPPIAFSDEDFHTPDPDQDDLMVITAEIARYDVSKVLVDQGSSVNILYWKTF